MLEGLYRRKHHQNGGLLQGLVIVDFEVAHASAPALVRRIPPVLVDAAVVVVAAAAAVASAAAVGFGAADSGLAGTGAAAAAVDFVLADTVVADVVVADTAAVVADVAAVVAACRCSQGGFVLEDLRSHNWAKEHSSGGKMHWSFVRWR